MIDLKDRVVLISGASGNLGRITAAAFERAGARLALVGRSLEHLKDAFGNSDENGAPVLVAADLSDGESTRGMAEEVIERCGAIDVVANLAGGFRSGASVHDTPVEVWDLMLDLNLRSLVHTAQAVVPHMLSRRTGAIVHVAARAGLAGEAGLGAYCASKSAAIRVVESMAAELGPGGVRVNCVLPGAIDSPSNRTSPAPEVGHALITAEALADLIVFLSSDAARALSGAAIPV